MKITYISKGDPENIRIWSGIVNHMWRALQKGGFDLESIYPFEFKSDNPVVRLKNRFYKRFSGKRYLLEREPIIHREIAGNIASRIGKDTGILFSHSSAPFSMLETRHRKIFYTDAVFADMVDFYESFSNLCPESIKNGNRLEKMAIDRCDMVVYSSEWAARGAVRHYGADIGKVKVLPFGANLGDCPGPTQVEALVRNRSSEECHLLFMGVDWERKGGRKALEIAKAMKESGIDVVLHMVGIRSLPVSEKPDLVIDYGFLNKNNPGDSETINSLFAKSHFFILPSKADCSPIVLCEANAFGLPAISTRVGGIPEIVRDGLNGFLFDPDSPAEKVAERIGKTWSNQDTYMDLCLSSYNEYRTRLNWDVTSEKLRSLILELA